MHFTQFNTVIVIVLVQVAPFIEQLCIQIKLNSDFYWSWLASIHLHIKYVASLGLRSSQGMLCTIPVWLIGHMYFENEPAILASYHFQLLPGLICRPVVREVRLTHFLLRRWTLRTASYFSPQPQTSKTAGSLVWQWIVFSPHRAINLLNRLSQWLAVTVKAPWNTNTLL